MIQKILSADNPVLRKKSKPVNKVDKRILNLIRDLKNTLLAQKDPKGVGLAASQIGKDLRVFVMRYEDSVLAVINPEIVKIEKKTKKN